MDDWISRITIPDLYPRKEDPYRPSGGGAPSYGPPGSMIEGPVTADINAFDGWMTTPSVRPVVYQRALNFNLTADVGPLPLANGGFQCDTIILDVLSTAANSVFWGYGSSINITTGQEVRAGLPIVVAADNTREQWEIQRLLEMIAAMIAAERGFPAPGPFRAPRVVFNASDIYVVAAAPTNVRVMLFLAPEYQ